ICCLSLLAAALGAAAGCGPQEDGGLALKIYYYTPPGDDGLRADPPPQGEAPGDITDYRVCVSAPDMGKIRCQNFVRAANPTKARISGLPVGRDRRVTFQGYTVSVTNFVSQWCGEASGVEVRDGATTQVSMYLSICSNFTPTRNAMSAPRAFHTATPMPDGRVLLVGGFNSVSGVQDCDVGRCHVLTATSSIDVYDPRTGSFAATSISLNYPRGLHTATLLPGGRLLVAGGAGRAFLRVSFPAGPRPVVEVDPADTGQAGSTAEVINLVTLAHEGEIPLAPASPRAHHAALAMAGGDALLLGGIVPSTNAALNTIARYQAAANAFVEPPAPQLREGRQGMALVPYGTASFLVWGGNHAAGGGPGQFAEIITEGADGSPLDRTPAFVTNDPGRGAPLFYPAGVSMGGTRALLTGGMIVDQSFEPLLTDKVRPTNLVRMVDLQEGAESFTEPTSIVLNFPRALHAMIPLPGSELVNGAEKTIVTAAVLGGVTGFTVLSQSFQLTNRVEFFTEQNVFREMQTNLSEIWMNANRAGHAVVALPDNTFLVSGGLNDQTGSLISLDSAEVFNPASRELQVR
ncbi:MAG TPA: kelch repeat-containing protein, partial [Myxococcota bacterium]|nr:kelch repeat-containing protein [Myxococcota bacterium]